MKLLIYQCAGRARERNLPVDLGYLQRFVENPPMRCECCGNEFEFVAKGRCLRGPSFDKIDNAKGYVAGNVGVICYECNMVKNCGTLEQHEAIAAYMRRHLAPAAEV